MNWKRYLLYGVLAAFILIQFFRIEKNEGPVTASALFMEETGVTPEIKTILEKACLDCHSGHTIYPWYSNMQPVAWWLDDHIQEGKKELNVDNWAQYNLRRKYHKLEEIEEMVQEGEMPLSSYTWVHTDAKLTDTERATLIDWAKAARKQMEAQYPMDSLIKKK